MLNSNTKKVESEYRPDQFNWKVRKVFNWLGSTEYMIEIIGLEGCVAYGNSILEAKTDLFEALCLWIRKFGNAQLPMTRQGAQVIIYAEPMEEKEFSYINSELINFKNAISEGRSDIL